LKQHVVRGAEAVNKAALFFNKQDPKSRSQEEHQLGVFSWCEKF
jgi:hypothetical protein